LGKADRPYLERVRRRLRQAGVLGRFEYLGEVTREKKIEMLRSLHAFSVPSVYHEAKGLYVLEALAAGVPVVQPAHGSFPELLEATGGGLLYDASGQAAAHNLAAALARLMDDSQLREGLAARGRQSVHEAFTDAVMAQQTWSLYEEVCGSASRPVQQSKVE
jgi:glycosyltransferase involved in cell wall biosynthesis